MATLEDFLSHPIQTLERALEIRKRIDQLNEKLKEFVGPRSISFGSVQVTIGEPTKRRGPKTMSPGARARIAAAQRARWAKSKTSHGSLTAVVMPAAKEKKKVGMSPEGRARIAAAQRARWAKAKGDTPISAPAKSTSKKKRQLSPEARARIVAAQKKRWAKVKKGQ
jgi:hypothetical protein